jgi:uncharacterized membrane protein YiaA
MVNVIWALFNVVVGYLLFTVGQVNSGNILSLVIFFIGAATISIMSSVNFQKKERE